MITREILKHVMPYAKMTDIERFVHPLDMACVEFAINTPERMAAFLAQIAHESGSLRYVKEIASGGAYEGRADLGNTEPGDGIRYKGRGLIQITGRFNYEKCGEALGADLVSEPELLEDPDYASRSACWYWKSRGLNELADAGNFRKITVRINGGTNGMADRLAYWERAKAELA